jgi:hypothetical protein
MGFRLSDCYSWAIATGDSPADRSAALALPGSWPMGSLPSVWVRKDQWPALPNVGTPVSLDFEDGTLQGFSAVVGDATFANSTAQAYAGTRCLAGTAGTGALTFALASPKYSGQGPISVAGMGIFPVDQTKTYTFRAQMRAATTGRNCYLFIYYFTADGTYITRPGSTATADNTTGWVQPTYTAAPPAGAALAALSPYVSSAPQGEVHYLDAVYFGP